MRFNFCRFTQSIPILPANPKVINAKRNIDYFFGPLKSPSLLPQSLVSTSSIDYDNPLRLSLLSHPFPPTAQ